MPLVTCRRMSLAILVLAFTVGTPAGAWTPDTQVAIALEAATLAPPDLARQIDRHRLELRRGAVEPFRERDPLLHMSNPGGGGRLAGVIAEQVEGTVAAIRAHQPFAEVVRRLGVVSHYLADANNPLNTSAADPGEATYFADYLRYVDDARPRFAVIFYGLEPRLDGPADLDALVARTLERGRRLYPSIGREYRRIRAPGAVERTFDDRSTAFGVGNLAFSHAVSDVAVVMRYVWLRGGGADERRYLPWRGEKLVRLPGVVAR